MKLPILLFTLIVFALVILFITDYNKPFVNTVVINLDRSYGRRISTSVQLYLNGVNFTRHSAVDGLNYTFTDSETAMFSELIKDTQGKMKPQKLKNVMSCALSHIQVWNENRDRGPLLVMEDDLLIYPLYKKNINSALSVINTVDPNWEIMWVSGGDPGDRTVVAGFNGHTIYRMNPPEYIGQGTVAYLLSERGVNRFLNKLNEKGCFAGIDYYLFNTLDVNHAYGIHNPLVVSGLFSSTI